MRLRALVGALLAFGLCSAIATWAHGVEKIHRVGALTASWGPTPQVVGLRDGLLALGYREGEDFELGVRFTQGDVGALLAAARQLIEYKVDLLIVDSDESAKAAQRATTKTPIVFAGVADPVGLGLVETFAQPGGNITGVTDEELELGPKRLQLFKQLIPGLRRVLFAYDATDVYGLRAAHVYREAARRVGLELVERAVRSQTEARAVLARVRSSDVEGILGAPGPSLNINGFILELAERTIPTMFGGAFPARFGGLASYGPDNYQTGRQAARLADKILRGADPGKIPVETNPKIEFVINLQVAQALGLTIPQEILVRADRLVR